MSDEFNIARAVLIGVLILEFGGLLIGYFIGSNTPTAPSLSGFNKYTAQITNETTALGNPLSITKLTAYPSSSGIFSSVPNAVIAFANVIIALINLILVPISFIVSLIILVGTSILLIVYMLVVLIPSLLNSVNLGVFASIYALVNGVVVIMLSLYIVSYIIGIIGRLMGKGNK